MHSACTQLDKGDDNRNSDDDGDFTKMATTTTTTTMDDLDCASPPTTLSKLSYAADDSGDARHMIGSVILKKQQSQTTPRARRACGALVAFANW